MRKSAAGMETAGQALTRGNLRGLSSQSSLSSDPRLGLPLPNGVKSDCCSAVCNEYNKRPCFFAYIMSSRENS